MRLCRQPSPPRKGPNGNPGPARLPGKNSTSGGETNRKGEGSGHHQRGERGKPGRARLLVYNPLRKIDFPVPSTKQSVGWGQAVGGLSSSANCSRGNSELSCKGVCLPSPSPACHTPAPGPSLQSLKCSWGPRRPRVGHTLGSPTMGRGAKGTPSSSRTE